MKVGSICTGIGGFELGLRLAGVEHELAWVSEIDPSANQVLAARFPDVPNIGDFTRTTPEAVDLLVGGFPCQPVSNAGRQKGTDDERWIFEEIVSLVGRLERPPGWLLFENVPGLLTANGGRAMATVVGRLASIGYVGSWGRVSAASVGCCHKRERVFVTARHSEGGGWDGPSVDRQTNMAPRPLGGANCFPRGEAPNAYGNVLRAEPLRFGGGFDSPIATPTDCFPWGDYELAVRQWEQVHGPAPWPVHGGRLNPMFVEWMMGFPTGWVTDVLPPNANGRSAPALRCLGNAVVPHVVAAVLADSRSNRGRVAVA